MNITYLLYGAVILYLCSGAFACRWIRLPRSVGCFFLPFTAFLLHAVLLHEWIDVGEGQNLSLMNLASQVIWVMVLIVCVLNHWFELKILSTLTFLLAAASILMTNFFPSYHLVESFFSLATLGHILLALLSFGLLLLASLSSILVFFQNMVLRKKYALHSQRYFPPLMVSEQLFFYTLKVGFFLLTLVLGIGFGLIFKENRWQEFSVKIILSSIAWVIFATLLLGIGRFQWKRKKIMGLTNVGLSLLWLSVALVWFLDA